MLVTVHCLFGSYLTSFKNGIFHCLVHPPLAISVKTFRKMLPERALPHYLLKLFLKHLLISLDFLAKVIHTGTSDRIPSPSIHRSFVVAV